MKPVPESRGQSKIADDVGNSRAGGDFTLTPPINRLSVQSGKWLIVALIMVSEWCFSADDQQFGRLFTTPEQRQRLQELREEHRRTSGSHKGTETELREMTGGYHARHSKTGMPRGPDNPPGVTLKGLIYKKDGTRMVWIKAQDETAALDYRELQSGETPDDGIAIRVPVSGKSVKLKPGQSWRPESGAVTDPSFLRPPSFPRRRESSKKTPRRDTL